MEIALDDVNWVESNDMLDQLLHEKDNLIFHPMEQGMEAEVMKLSWGKDSFVLKV